MLKRSATLALVVLAASLLAVGLALPASAQQTPATFSGPVTAGQTITVTCPEGHQVQLEGGAPNAGVTFYRNTNRKAVLSTPGPTSVTATSASWLVPKGAKYADATVYCVPIVISQPLTAVEQATGAPVVLDCPGVYPWLHTVIEVAALDPLVGQYLSTPYETTETGIIIGALPETYIWRATLVCTSLPPQ
jgi:hypothetical protein